MLFLSVMSPHPGLSLYLVRRIVRTKMSCEEGAPSLNAILHDEWIDQIQNRERQLS
jgi:hypothetical protein